MANHVSIRRDRFRQTIKRFPRSLRERARAFLVEAIMRANWKDGECMTDKGAVFLKRGQFPMGRDEMAEELGCSPQNIRTIRNRFEKLGELTSDPTNEGSVLSIVFYDEYVCDNLEPNQQSNQDLTSDQPAPNHSEDSKASKDSKREHGKPHLSLPEKNLSLDECIPTNRWLKAFQNQRPGAGHPLANLNATEIEDARGRVADLITKQGEVRAIELLHQVFADKDRPRPTSVKQAVLFCNQKLEKAKKENSNVDADGYVTTGSGNGDSWLYSEDD